MSDAPVVFWFREDLRLSDNPALSAAVATGRPLVCLFVYDADSFGKWGDGGARKWWLHHALERLDKDIEAIGGRLIIREGKQADVVKRFVEEVGADQVFWTRRYAKMQTDLDASIKSALEDEDVAVTSINGRLLFEPWAFETQAGDPYRVFTPFWKAMKSRGDVRGVCERVEKLTAFEADVETLDLADLNLLPTSPDWAKGFEPVWQPGEAGAKAQLDRFFEEAAANYDEDRNRPDKMGTSRLSPHLQYGEIGPVQIWHATLFAVDKGDIPEKQAWKFLSEIAWREFSYVLIFHNPKMLDTELQEKFQDFPWAYDDDKLEAWKRGQTGYPIVDAGMRELWQTGWMHNRVRMIVGSFLVKHLLQDWRDGMAWFWDTLVDADIANNTASWQWIAGCGADAAPYFRIFNPMTQGEKFDPNGDYIRQFVPELNDLPTKHLYAPWEASADVLKKAGVELGKTYPKPIVDHMSARERALEAYESIK